MKKIYKISIGLLLALVLSVSAPILGFTGVPEYALAATNSEPKTTISKLNLYVGYKTYQIKFENLSKSATISFKSSKAKVAKVSDAGIITPVAKGKTTVSVTMKQNKKTYTSKIQVTVDLSNIKISAKTGDLMVGDVFTFKATANGTDSKVTWSVSNKSIGKIDNKSGKFTALVEGEVDVIATAGNISSSCTVNVDNPKLSTASKNIICYEQTIIYIHAPDMASDEEIIYSIGNKDVVDCVWGDWEGEDSALLIDPVNVGKTTITITSSKTSDKLVINVEVVKAPEERDPKAKELTAKEIYSKCAPATVELQVTKADGGEYVGSGFFIYSGVLITNYHVIEGATEIIVITNKKKQYKVNYIYGYDKNYDIAVLSIDAVTEHLTLNKGDITIGETVYALGSPRGLTGSLSDGIVSSDSRVMEGVEYIQVTAPISGGNSGGPLLNAYGEVIGINTFILLDSQNLNFAVNVFQYMKLNFNTPIKSTEFYETNKQNSSSSEQDPGVMKEDESKSGDISTAQYVPNNTIVNGKLANSNVIDGYHITLSNSSSVVALCITENASDLDDINFTIVDKDMNIIADSENYTGKDGSKYLAIDDTIPAGDYWIVVYSLEDNINTTIEYSFLVYY